MTKERERGEGEEDKRRPSSFKQQEEKGHEECRCEGK